MGHEERKRTEIRGYSFLLLALTGFYIIKAIIFYGMLSLVLLSWLIQGLPGLGSYSSGYCYFLDEVRRFPSDLLCV